MKKGFCILLAALFLAVFTGCGHAEDTASVSRASSLSSVESASEASSTNREVSSQEGEEKDQAIGLQKGDVISVTGEDHDFQLHSIDFLNRNEGWVIEDRYSDDSDELYSQLLHTSDGGKSWSTVYSTGQRLETVCFTDEKTGWAVARAEVSVLTDGQEAPCETNYYILSTTDGGLSWDRYWESGPDAEASNACLWFQDSKIGFALAGGSLLKTRDGQTWSKVSFRGKDFSPEHFVFIDAKNGWVTGTSAKMDRISVLHTTDGGTSWTVQFEKKKTDSEDGSLGTMGIDFINAKVGWFLTADNATLDGELYHTADGGAHWNPVGSLRCGRPTPGNLCFVSEQVGWIPLDPGAGPIDGGLSYTLDGGKSFQVVGDSPNSEQETRAIISAREIRFLSPQEGWAVGRNLNSGDFLLHTTDGGKTWEQRLPALEPTKDLSFFDNKNGFGLGALSDSDALLKTTDGGDIWETVTTLNGSYRTRSLSFISPSEGWLLAWPASDSGIDETTVVLHTTDGGKTWKMQGRISSDESECDYFRFFDKKSGMIMEQEGSNILLTEDGGKTWKSSSQAILTEKEKLFYGTTPLNGWPLSVPNGYDCKAVSFLSARYGMVLAANSDSRLTLLVTRDGRKSWEPHLFPKGTENILYTLRAGTPLRFADSMNGCILTDYGLLRTKDGGKSWEWH